MSDPADRGAPAQNSFWRTLRTVAWGFLGIRKRSEYQQDLAQVNPLHIVVAGIAGVLLLVLLLLGIVNWVVSGSAPAA